MVVLNAALLSLLLPAAVLARPNQHEKLHHKRHGHEEGHKPPLPTDIHPCGIHGGPPGLCHPSESDHAPYPTGNITQPGPTGTAGVSTSREVVTISSVIEVVPVPVTPGGHEVTPTGSPNGSGGENGGNGPGGNGGPEECGPATVTVTSAKTVTVTVAGAGSQQSSAPPQKEASPDEKKPPVPEQKAVEHPQPEQQKAEENTALPEQAQPQEKKPKEEAPKAEKAKSEEKHAQPENTQPEQAKSQPQSQPESHPAKPQTEEKNKSPESEHKPESKPENKPQTKQEEKPDTKPEEKPKDTPKKSPTGGKKGILYKDISQAKAMSGHVSWGCNWDSSPIPAIGHASGALPSSMDWVPQMWGPKEPQLSLWEANSKGADYVMAFNEPNQPQGAGGCGPMSPSSAVESYEKIFKSNKAAGQKIISPCVSNEAHEWLETFISSVSSGMKPDAVCFHWYGMNLKELKGVVENFAGLQSKHGIPELWMTEWALNADIPTNDAKELLDWLDNESGVNRYAYNNEKLSGTPGVKQAYCGSS